MPSGTTILIFQLIKGQIIVDKEEIGGKPHKYNILNENSNRSKIKTESLRKTRDKYFDVEIQIF